MSDAISWFCAATIPSRARPLWVLVVSKRSDWRRQKAGYVRSAVIFGVRLLPHRSQERLDTHNVHDASEIVGQYVQCHL